MARKPLDVDRCPDAAELERYAAKLLLGARNEQVYLHLKHCAACLRRMAELTRVPSPGEIVRPASSSWWSRMLRLVFRR